MSTASTERPIRVPYTTVRKIVEWRLEVFRSARKRLKKAPEAAEALHEFRKTARRLQSSVRMTKWALKPTDYQRAVAAVADVTSGTGRLRDADVQAERLGRLADNEVRAALSDAVNGVSKKKRVARVAKAVARSKRTRLADPLLGRIAGGDDAAVVDPLAAIAADLLRRADRLDRELEDVAAHHAFRLEMKAYRYACEALARHFRGVSGRGIRERGDAAKDVTRVLGRYLDAVNLQNALAVDASERPAGVARFLERTGRTRASALAEFRKGWWGQRWKALRGSLEAHVRPPKAAGRVGLSRPVTAPIGR